MKMEMLPIRMENHTLTLFHTFNLLSLPYPINTITRPHMSLETSCLTEAVFNFKILIYFSCIYPSLHLEILPSFHRLLSHNQFRKKDSTCTSILNTTTLRPLHKKTKILNFCWIGRTTSFD